MAIREMINRNGWIAGAGAGVLVLVSVIAIVRRGAAPDQAVAGATGLAHYTTDDGATWFTDSADKIPPFKKDGKDAVRAYVYRDADGTEFVSHLERYTTEAQRALADSASLPPEQRALEDPTSTAGGLEGIEVKRPKARVWTRAVDPRGQEIMQPLSPSGKAEGLQYVAPQ